MSIILVIKRKHRGHHDTMVYTVLGTKKPDSGESGVSINVINAGEWL